MISAAAPLLIDTDVMVDYLRGSRVALDFLGKNIQRIAFSAVVVAELYAGVGNDRQKEDLDENLAAFRVIPISVEIAKMGGLLRSRYGKSHGTSLADALLAATVLQENADLATRNVKHYPMLKGLRPAYGKA
jgi:predicted nucleic acid-binding protein